MKLQELNQQELNELLGGETDLELAKDKHVNNQAYCACIYHNSGVTNINNATPCGCKCIASSN